MTYYGYNDARKRANKKYMTEKIDSVSLYTPKGKKSELQALASQRGVSLNALINKMIDYALTHPEILDDDEN